ncbi:hypothetical protein F66182_7099 [Fusarium sp. NRRL 66182]|nr:hypothetical protein F66182_7099 [Fusarium sp. NRRL 66182]
MSYTLSDAAVVQTRDILNSLSAILKKAESHPKASTLPQAKLAEDMLDLSFQVHFLTDLAQKIIARTSGAAPLELSMDNCSTFEAYHARIAQVLEVVDKADRDVIDKRVGETTTMGIGPGMGEMEIKTRDYVAGYSVPNLFFHLMTAYSILRKEGVDIGKRDYIDSFMSRYIPDEKKQKQ